MNSILFAIPSLSLYLVPCFNAFLVLLHLSAIYVLCLRYALFPQLFDAVPMGEYATSDAIKTAAVLGQKGDDYWQCGAFSCSLQ